MVELEKKERTRPSAEELLASNDTSPLYKRVFKVCVINNIIHCIFHIHFYNIIFVLHCIHFDAHLTGMYSLSTLCNL